MDLHFHGFEVVEFLSDLGLVSGRQPGPGFVCPSVVLVSLRHFDVVVEANDFPLLELLDSGSERKFPQQCPSLLFLEFPSFFRSLSWGGSRVIAYK